MKTVLSCFALTSAITAAVSFAGQVFAVQIPAWPSTAAGFATFCVSLILLVFSKDYATPRRSAIARKETAVIYRRPVKAAHPLAA